MTSTWWWLTRIISATQSPSLKRDFWYHLTPNQMCSTSTMIQAMGAIAVAAGWTLTMIGFPRLMTRHRKNRLKKSLLCSSIKAKNQVLNSPPKCQKKQRKWLFKGMWANLIPTWTACLRWNLSKKTKPKSSTKSKPEIRIWTMTVNKILKSIWISRQCKIKTKRGPRLLECAEFSVS